jgi:hypothetical protein
MAIVAGSSKKRAKTAAATAALAKLNFNLKDLSLDGCKKSSVLVEEQERADYIGR